MNTTFIIDRNNQFNPICKKAFIPYQTPSPIVYSRKIETIRFRGGKVQFLIENNSNYGPLPADRERDVYLQAIRVYDTGNRLVREITFHRSVFSGSTTTYLNKRYKLDEIRIRDGNGQIVEKYAFQYKTGSLPDQLSKSHDHWGYHNGRNGLAGMSAVPVLTVNALRSDGWNTPVNFQIGEANKEPDENAMQWGMLSGITWPAGGKTFFTYEANKYRSGGDTLKTAGGLRIAGIRDYSPETGRYTYRIFKYGKDENGGGIAFWKVKPADYMYEQENYYYAYGCTSRYRVYYSRSLTDLFYSGGSPVVYDEVAEYRSSTSSTDNATGKTVYRYDQTRYYEPYRVESTNIFINPRGEWKQGQLTGKDVLKQNGDTVSRTRYRYTVFKEAAINGGTAYRERILIGLDQDAYRELLEQIIHKIYYIHTGVKKLVSETTTEMLPTGRITTRTEHDYDPTSTLLYPYQTRTTASDGATVTDLYKYPYNMTGLTGAAETARQKLVSNGHINALMEHRRTKGGKTQTVQTEYKVVGNIAVPAQVKANTGTNQTLEPRIHYHSYDQYGNPTCISLADGSIIVYVWGYNGKYPVAKIESNSNVSSFYTTVLNAIGTSNMSTLNGNPADAQVQSIFANLRNHAGMGGSLMTTCTYKPLIGMTSETDPSGRTVFYEYDNFGRLKCLKDEDGKVLEEYRYHYAE